MYKSFDEIPENRKEFILPYLTKPDLNQARDSFVYILRMFWQARFDKMSPLYQENLDWVSFNFLPENVEYTGIKFGENLVSSDFDHYELATSIFDNINSLYLGKTEQPEPKGFFERFTSFFSK